MDIHEKSAPTSSPTERYGMFSNILSTFWYCMVLSFLTGIHFQKADTQPSGLYRYSLGLPNQPKHKSPPNELTDFRRGFTDRKTSFQGGVVNNPASVIIPLYFAWCIKEPSDMIIILSITSDRKGTLLQLFIRYDFVTY